MNKKSFSDVENIIRYGYSGNLKDLDALYRDCRGYLEMVISNALRRYQYPGGSGLTIDIETETEDMIDEIMIKVFENIDKYDPSRAGFKTWITHIATYHTIDWLKKKRLPYTNDFYSSDEDSEPAVNRIPSSEMSISKSLIVKESVNDILDTIQNLKNETFRDYLVLKFMFLISDDDIAGMFEVTESCVRSNICRSLKGFHEEFFARNREYAGIDIEQLSNIVRDGGIQITDEQLKKIENRTARIILQKICLENTSIHVLADEGGILEKEIHHLIKLGMKELASKGLKRAVKPAIEFEISYEESKTISNYVNLVLAENKIPATRGSPDSAKIQELKSITDLLASAMASCSTSKSKFYNIGSLLMLKADKNNIKLDDLAAKLSLDIHQLSEILNNSIPEDTKSDKTFLKKLSKFLDMSVEDVKTIIAVSKPPKISSATRCLKDIKDDILKGKIKQILAKKYKPEI